MEDYLKHWNIKNKHDLEWNVLDKLHAEGKSISYIEAVRADGLEYLRQRKSDKARAKQLANMWNVHITPLKLEIKRVVASLAYDNYNKNNADPRQMALKAYRTVLTELLRRMDRESSSRPFDDRPTMSPIEYAKVKNVPNGGEHWTDYVPTHVKQRVITLFDAVPHKPKAKRKIPFERIVGIELHELKMSRLIRRTEIELARHKQELSIDSNNNPLRERIQRIESALAEIKKIEVNEYVPTSWQGLLTHNQIKDTELGKALAEWD